MSQYDIDPTRGPHLISQGLTEKVSVYNVGSNRVYVAGNPATNNGFPLEKGDTITWDLGSALYIYSDAPGKVFVSPEGHEYTSANAIAAEIIDAGLADDIAASIQLRGAPPIDRMERIHAQVIIPPYVAGTIVDLDVSEYQSVIIRISESVSAAGTAPTSYRTMQLQWRDPTNVFTVFSETFLSCDDNAEPSGQANYYTVLVTDVRSPILRIKMLNDGPALSVAIGVNVFGSYKSREGSRYQCVNPYAGKGGFTIYGNGHDKMVTISGGKAVGAKQEIISSYSGPATVHFYVSGVTAVGNIYLIDADNGSSVFATFTPAIAAGNQTVKFDVILPNRPLRISMLSSLVATSVLITVTYNG